MILCVNQIINQYSNLLSSSLSSAGFTLSKIPLFVNLYESYKCCGITSRIIPNFLPVVQPSNDHESNNFGVIHKTTGPAMKFFCMYLFTSITEKRTISLSTVPLSDHKNVILPRCHLMVF